MLMFILKWVGYPCIQPIQYYEVDDFVINANILVIRTEMTL